MNDNQAQSLLNSSVPILTCAETAALERRIADPNQNDCGDAKSGAPIAGIELMARAGAACFALIKNMIKARSGKPLILCGPGGNGGDGFVIAQHFLESGQRPIVYVLASPPVGSDAARMLAKYVKNGGEITDNLQADVSRFSVVVDALFGAGLSRPFDNVDLLTLLREARVKNVPVFAVDMPSGLSGDTGRVLGDCAGADLTLTFFTPKPGHFIARGPAFCGALKVDRIGTDFPENISEVLLVQEIALAGFYQAEGHKYSYGHALIFSGGFGRSGAARLSAVAALRLGAGLVTIAAPKSAMPEIAAQVTSIQIRPIDSLDDMKSLMSDPRYNAVGIGPGLGTELYHKELVKAVLRQRRRNVLDADALSLFANAPDELFEELDERTILTPHAGEFAKLFPDLKLDDGKVSKLDQVRRAACRSGAVVLLKGPDTIIAAPDGRVNVIAAVYDAAAPMLATAGSGDVLTGLIAGRLARENAGSLLDLSAQAVWIHQTLGRRLGPGLIAEDLPNALPELLGELVN